MVCLITGDPSGTRNTALFENLIINTVNGATPQPTVFSQDENPPYGTLVSITAKPQQTFNCKSNFSIRTIVGGSIVVPAVLPGKKVEYSVYTLNGELLEKKKIDGGTQVKIDRSFSKSEKVLIVQFKTID